MDTKFAYKNICVLGFSFLMLFAAFEALQTLQTSIHKDPKIGFLNLCIIYVSCTISCVLIPPIALSKLGYKYSIVVSMFGYILYTAVQFYPVLWLMILCALILGKRFQVHQSVSSECPTINQESSRFMTI